MFDTSTSPYVLDYREAPRVEIPKTDKPFPGQYGYNPPSWVTGSHVEPKPEWFDDAQS